MPDVAPLRYWFVVVEVAAVGGHGAGGVAAGSGADRDGLRRVGWRAAAEFGGVEESAAVVGEEPGEQHLITIVRVDGARRCVACSVSPGMNPDRSASSAGRVAVAEQAGQRHHDSDPDCAGPPDQLRCL